MTRIGLAALAALASGYLSGAVALPAGSYQYSPIEPPPGAEGTPGARWQACQKGYVGCSTRCGRELKFCSTDEPPAFINQSCRPVYNKCIGACRRRQMDCMKR